MNIIHIADGPGRCWIVAYTNINLREHAWENYDHWETFDDQAHARARYKDLLNTWDVVSMTAVIESSDYETHPKFLVENCDACNGLGWINSNNENWEPETQKCDACQIYTTDTKAQQAERES